MKKITTTIKREWLREIVAGRKRVEYREIKPYWIAKLRSIEVPFLLRIINGMQDRAPEATIVVRRVRTNRRLGLFELHLGKIINVRHWDRRREQPRTS